MAEKPKEQESWLTVGVPPRTVQKCSKCGIFGADPYTLARGYHTDLCISCANLWHVYAMESGQWAARCNMDACYNDLVGRSRREVVPLEHWELHEGEKRRADLALFRMAETWVHTAPGTEERTRSREE